MTELWQLGALELAERIRSREVSSREVLEAHLERVDACNGALNAVVRVLADEARATADAADASLAAGDDVGQLHGVPCTVKENIDVAGTPTTQGVKAMADAVATIDAPTVERMRAAVAAEPDDAAALCTGAAREAFAIHEEQLSIERAIGRHGADLFPDGAVFLHYTRSF